MAALYKQFHYAVCSVCRAVARTSETGAFIDCFFLPDVCPSCGSDMQVGHKDSDGHWIHQVTKKRFARRKWWHLFRSWEVIETTEWECG